MIEPTGPYGIDYKQIMRIKILNCMSDGEWYTATQIADCTGLKRTDILKEVQDNRKGLAYTHDIQSRHIDDPADPGRMITQYRFKLVLRPCLWCNSAPAIWKTNTRSPRYSIKCKCGIETVTYETPTDAIRKWNTRFGE